MSYDYNVMLVSSAAVKFRLHAFSIPIRRRSSFEHKDEVNYVVNGLSHVNGSVRT